MQNRSTGEKYWLRDWLDDTGANSLARATKALSDRKALSRLQEIVSGVPYTTEPIENGNLGIVAGRGIDLSNALECSHWDCKRKQIDNLFSRVWHYFDSIVVVAAPASRLQSVSDFTDPKVRRFLLDHIQLLLYLRKLGVDDLLRFRQKPPPCEVHVRDHLVEARLPVPEDYILGLATQLAVEAEIKTSLEGREDGVLGFTFNHKLFEHTVWGHLHDGEVETSDGQTSIAVAKVVVRRYLSHLTSDVRTSQSIATPLGCVQRFQTLILGRPRGPATSQNVAFELKLPVLQGVSVAELLRLRATEKDSFLRFRRALRKAVDERTRAANASSPDRIAAEIQADLIEPSLHEIRQRLRAAEGVLKKKATVTLGMGVLATACGILTGSPLITTTGVATAMSALAAENKFIEERRDIELSDMYFLWKAKH